MNSDTEYLVLSLDFKLYPIDTRLTYLLPTQIKSPFMNDMPTGSYELPIFSHWLFNFIRYGMTDDIKTNNGYFPRNPNYQMAKLSDHMGVSLPPLFYFWNITFKFEFKTTLAN